MAEGLSKRLGQPVIVDAASRALAAISPPETVAKAAPDGYTLGLITGGHAISGALYKSLQYQPVDSFEMISTIVYYALVIAVRNDYPAKTLGELIAMAKAKPGSAQLRIGRLRQHPSPRRKELLNASSPASKWCMFPTAATPRPSPRCSRATCRLIVGTSVLVAPQVASGTACGRWR